MKKIYITLGIVLIIGIGLVAVTQILFRGDYYRQFERSVFYKNCPAYVYITGEYAGATPGIAVIKSAVDSLGFEKAGVERSGDKKIVVIVAVEDIAQMTTIREKVDSELSKQGDFQVERVSGNSAYKAKTCPLD